MIISLTDQIFDAEVLHSKSSILVAFVSSKCIVCKKLDPILEKVAKNATVKIGKLDVSKYTKISRQYCISAPPTLLLFARGIINQYVAKETPELIASFLSIHA